MPGKDYTKTVNRFPSGKIGLPLPVLLLLLLAATAPAAVVIMPLAEVRQGMRGTGRTVFNGDKIEDFQAEILGILQNTGPRQSLILARLSGGPLEHTGIMQGMSGSPVYIDGKLIGAVAMAFPFAKDPIAGIRPIEEMFQVDSMPGRSTPGRTNLAANHLLPALDKHEAAFGDKSMTEVATP
jgi:hypothetical protein